MASRIRTALLRHIKIVWGLQRTHALLGKSSENVSKSRDGVINLLFTVHAKVLLSTMLNIT